MVREIVDGVWAIETSFQMMGIEMGARLTIVRVGGDLLVYAPYAISDEDEAAIREKGTVRDIVAPNTAHFTEIGEFARRFPKATLWALPELDKKLDDVPHQNLEEAPEEWKKEFDFELFEGAKGFREWVFCHRASRSLVVTDLGFHLPEQQSLMSHIAARLNDVDDTFGPSRFERMLMKLGDSAKEKHCIEIILGWEFDRIISGHGVVTDENAKVQLRAAYHFLGV